MERKTKMIDSEAQEVGVQSESTELPKEKDDDLHVWQVGADFDKWLEHFYKECGREITLAYTTLNQMKNWAMVIVAALISAIVTLNKTSTAQQTETDSVNVAVLLVAVVAYVFSLRFFIRAILCYINLVRWNNLQSSIVSLKLIPKPQNGIQVLTEEIRRAHLLGEIVNYYHNWASPIDRKTQLVSNLKLGFALMLALPLFFILVAAVNLWGNYLAFGLLAFALGSSIVEFQDFARSSFFDTPAKRKERIRLQNGGSDIFPKPASRIGYLVLWGITTLVSSTLAMWPKISELVTSFCSRSG